MPRCLCACLFRDDGKKLFYFTYNTGQCWAAAPFFDQISLCIDLDKGMLVGFAVFFFSTVSVW